MLGNHSLLEQYDSYIFSWYILLRLHDYLVMSLKWEFYSLKKASSSSWMSYRAETPAEVFSFRRIKVWQYFDVFFFFFFFEYVLFMAKLVFDCWSWIFLKWIVSHVWSNGLWPDFFRIHLIRGQQMMARSLLFSYTQQTKNVTFLMGFSHLKNWGRIYSRDNMWSQNIKYLLYYP